MLRTNFIKYWTLSTHFAIDEAITRFRGRSGDTVNIPTKPTPIGFKFWVLADRGHVYKWLCHVRGSKPSDGPQGIRKAWLEDGFNKTQAVISELFASTPNSGTGHCIWMDNL